MMTCKRLSRQCLAARSILQERLRKQLPLTLMYASSFSLFFNVGSFL